MCIGVPVKIIEKNGSEAVVAMDGVCKRINLDLVPGAKEDDYVLLHAGCAIQKINEREAKKTLELLKKFK